MHVLTLTPFYPSAADDAQGCFIAEPLSSVERLGIVNTVIAVRPFYRSPTEQNNTALPATRRRFFSLPGGFGLPSAGALLFAQILADVRRRHRAQPIDLIHAHAALPCGHAAGLLSRELAIPFVVTVHGLDAYSSRQTSGYARQWCERVSRWVYKTACKVICISERVREQVMEGTADLNTEVIYNGADPNFFAPHANDDASNTILTVGNLIPTKGHARLIRAYASIRQRFHGATLKIIGDGPERARLTRLAAELGISNSVRFLGRQNRTQVAQAMQSCALFTLPSHYEGLGCVYLEAMSAAKPVIACRGQGIAEIIQHGRTGWLVDTAESNAPHEELSAALATLLESDSLRQRMGIAARQVILQNFTLDHQAARLCRLYGECVK